MTTVVDYASLTQAIQDWAHRSDIASYVDGFIQRAQGQIERDIPTRNFGNYIRFQENEYPATAIANGICPVPSDWLSPKSFQILDGAGNAGPLIFKAATWIYDTYPQRQAQGIPAYIARDSGAGSSNSIEYTANAGQTAFSLTGILGNVLFVTLDGQVLVAGTDYTVAGSILTLTSGAVQGQVVFIQGAVPGFTANNYVETTATSGQTAFSISGLTSGSQVLFASLDGSVLLPTTDYSVNGSTLTLTTGALTGQVLFVQGAPSTLTASQLWCFIFGPYPDSAYTVQGTYYQKAPQLSSTQTTNWMVLYAPNVLLAACMMQVAQFLKDQAMMQSWGQDYQQALLGLVNQDKAERWAASTLQVEVG